MSDELIPKKTGDNDSADKQAKNESSAYPAKQFSTGYYYIPKNVKTAALVLVMMGLIEAVSLFLWHAADVFHGFVVLLFHWLSLCGQLLVVAIPIIKALKRPRLAWFTYISVSVMILFFLIWSSLPDSLSLPKLTWAFEDRRFPELRIHLTNDGFFPRIKEGTNVDISGEIALVVPVTSTNELAELRFVVLNNEPNKSVDGGISVWVSFSEPLKHGPAGPSAAWTPVQSKLRNGSTVWLEHPFKLKPKTSNPLNDLFLYVPGGWPYPPQEGALLLNLTADAGRYPALVAKLIFPVVVKPIAPFVLKKGESNVVVIPE